MLLRVGARGFRIAEIHEKLGPKKLVTKMEVSPSLCYPARERSHIPQNRHFESMIFRTSRLAKHIKNATWPEGCGQQNKKTRKRENQKTEKTEKTRKREIENQKTGTLLAVFGFRRFRRFRVFGFSPFSRFPRFRGFLVFAVFAFSPFSRFRRFRVHRLIPPVFAFSGFRVFVFTSAFTCSVLAFSCYRMDCFGTYFTHAQSRDNVRVHSATEWTASVHTLRMPEAVTMFVFIVLRNGLLRYIPYACPKL